MAKNIKTVKRLRLKKKIRSKIAGKTARLRLSIFRSNKHIYAQVIDDAKGKTLVSASDAKIKTGTKKEKAEKVGKMIAEAALAAKVGEVVFDRSGFKYAGRVRLLAEAARKAGLKF